MRSEEAYHHLILSQTSSLVRRGQLVLAHLCAHDRRPIMLRPISPEYPWCFRLLDLILTKQVLVWMNLKYVVLSPEVWLCYNRYNGSYRSCGCSCGTGFLHQQRASTALTTLNLSVLASEDLDPG